MKKILITYHVPHEAYAPFEREAAFVCPPCNALRMRPEEILEAIPEYDGIMVVAAGLPRETILAGRNLKVIGNMGAGYDKIDVETATELGIPVVNTPTAVTAPTAELTVTLMLALMRQVVARDMMLRGSGVITPTPVPGNEIVTAAGKTLGIIGFGRIGRKVAAIAHALGMKIVYFDRFPAPAELEAACGAQKLSFEEVLKVSDVVTLHCPYTRENHHLMNAAAFAGMKRGAFFINAARGKLHDEAALIAALNSGHLKGAALDVYEQEPTVDPRLLTMRNVVLSPHMGTLTYDTRIVMLHEALGGMMQCLRGEKAGNIVNPAALENRRGN